MLSRDERNEIRRRKRLLELEMYNQYDVVTSFYPAQQLTLTLSVEDVINIMNCDFSQAMDYMKEVQKSLGKEEGCPVRTFDFCDYLDIDDMFIQVFLASLKSDEALAPVRTGALVSATPEETSDGPFRMLDDVKEGLQNGIMESFETIEERLRIWKIKNPLGEPMCCPAFKNWRTVVRPFEVAQILGIHIDTARDMFKEARLDQDLPKQRFMSIRLFCVAHHLDEEDIRKGLAYMYDEKEEPRD